MGQVGAIILAAGGSSRLGQPKQLLEFRGEVLIHAVVRAAGEGGCHPVCVVTGDVHERVALAVRDLAPMVVHHAAWQRGIGSSIRAGLQNLASPDHSAVALLACDQPALDRNVVRALLERYSASGQPIVASRYAGTLGVPAIFGRACFSQLAQLPDESGAKSVIEANQDKVATIEFPGGAFDLDLPAEVEDWRQRCRKGMNG